MPRYADRYEQYEHHEAVVWTSTTEATLPAGTLRWCNGWWRIYDPAGREVHKANVAGLAIFLALNARPSLEVAA